MRRASATLHRQEVAAGGADTENRTGMPAGLRAGLERLSNLDLSTVRVHHNSSRPAQLDALAYTQGTEIHVGPGQEEHLPHEGWHVVQQMQGRVRPTTQVEGVAINDDRALESEADVMGARARQRSERGGAPCCHVCAAAVGGGNLAGPREVVATFADAQAVASQRMTTGPGSGEVAVVQRVTNFTPAPPSREINLAKHLIDGHKFTGITVPTLNNRPVFEEKDARAAIKDPTLQSYSNPDGTVVAEVSQVPTNEAGFVMAVPTNGPWSTMTDKARVVFLFRQIPGGDVPLSCLIPGARTTLTVHGQPTDADFVTNALTHEGLHAADHEIGFNNVIVPWDANLQAAQAAGTGFPGATWADAQAALYQAMGGTPREIAARHGELEERGIRLVLISPQRVARTRKLATETGIPSAFKVDRGNAAARELGIADEVGVMPTVIVTNANGTILYSDETDNYRVRPEPDIYLSILKRAGAISSA